MAIQTDVFKSAGVDAARIAGRDPEMDAVAGRMADAIRGIAELHRDTGAYIGTISVRNVRGRSGVRDREVIVADPAAESIEWGHVAGDGEGARWVPGLGIVTRAYQAVR